MMIFDYFKHAYVVNMDRDTDRLAKIDGRLRRLGIPYERVAGLRCPDPNVRHPTLRPGAFGCAATHLHIYKLAKERRQRNFIVFEDDCVFRDDVADVMRKIVSQLDGVPWDLFYFGLDLVSVKGRFGPNLGIVNEGYHSHAYAVSEKGVDRIVATTEERLSKYDDVFDGFWDGSLVKVYADPILAIQEPNFSHTFLRPINRAPQYFARGFFDMEDFRNNSSEWREIEAAN
jgi:GR25 family glycosyltransferase involved in LPS biosynthesis